MSKISIFPCFNSKVIRGQNDCLCLLTEEIFEKINDIAVHTNVRVEKIRRKIQEISVNMYFPKYVYITELYNSLLREYDPY